MSGTVKRAKTRRPRGAGAGGNFEDSKAYVEAQQREERSARQKKTERLRALRNARDSIDEAEN